MREFYFRNIPTQLEREKLGFGIGCYLAYDNQDQLEIPTGRSTGKRLQIEINSEDEILFLKLANQKYNGNFSLTASVILNYLSTLPVHAGRNPELDAKLKLSRQNNKGNKEKKGKNDEK